VAFVTLTQPPVFIQQGEYSARLTRNFLDLVATEGVTASGDFEVSERAASPAMQVDVAPGRAFITGDDIPNQFRYVALSEDVVELVVQPADLVDPRIDLVVVRILDSDAGVVGDEARVEIIAGVPDASPVAPTVPPTALALAEVAVAANVVSILNADITDLRVQAAAVFPQRIDTLDDVDVTTVVDGDILQYFGGTWLSTPFPPPLDPFFLMGA